MRKIRQSNNNQQLSSGWCRNWLLVLLVLLSLNLRAQNNQGDPVSAFVQNGVAELNYLSVKMPLEEKNLGLVGIHYTLDLNKWSYAGLGLFGAVSGIRGGFFTLDVQAGVQWRLLSGLYVRTGVHFGGGGGASAPDGGGAYVLPHVNLGYQFTRISLEAGYSYVNFFDNGAIEGNQLTMGVKIPFSYRYATFDHLQKELYLSEDRTDSGWLNSSHQFSILVHLNNVYLLAEKNESSASFTGRTIRTAGVEAATYFREKSFLFIKTDGAYYGIPAGYMDAFIGVGHQMVSASGRFKALGKLGFGAAGGGGVDTQGGFIAYPSIALEQQVFNNTYLRFDAGLMVTPNLEFMGFSYGVGLNHNLYVNGLKSTDGFISSAKFKGLRFIVGQELSLRAARNSGEPQDLYQIFLQINYYLTKNLYASGHTSFANFGNAGAYAEGIVGGGVSTFSGFSKRMQLFGQIMVGAAGGGGISTGQGLIVKPGMGATVFLSNTLGARASFGQAIGLTGDLNSTFIQVGLDYRLSILKANNN